MLDKLYITPRQWLQILRWSLYALLFLLAMMLQTVVLGNRSLLGAKPHFIPVVLCCVCLREGPERGGLYALLCSLIWCLSGADMGSVSILTLTAVPVLGAMLCRAVLNNRFLPCLLICLAALLAEQGMIFLIKYFFSSMDPALFLRDGLPCIGVSLLSQPLVYLLVKRIAKIGESYEST